MSSNGGRGTRRFVLGAHFLVLLGGSRSVHAQVDSSHRAFLEIGTSVGGTWLEGARAPRIASGVGLMGGLGIQRPFSTIILGGAAFRALSAPVSLREAGLTWDRGKTLEMSLLATFSVLTRARGSIRPSVDLAGGVTRLSGPRDIVPFKDASNIAPIGEVGISVRRGRAYAEASRRELTVFTRYSMTRLRMSTPNAIAEGGTVSRFLIGVRATL